MSFLIFNFTKNFIYVVAYWILDIPVRILVNLKGEYFTWNEDIAKTEYIFFAFDKLSELLAIFLVLYIKCRTVSQREKSELKKNDKNKLIYNNQEKVRNKYFFIKTIIIGLLECYIYSCYWISYAITGFKSDEISENLIKSLATMFDTIMRYILGIFILENKIHKHGKFSFILMIIGFVILLLADFLDIIFIKNQVKI